jgi:hypothetical protein
MFYLLQGNYKVQSQRGKVMTTTNRTGERGEIPSRKGRYIQKGGYWYYTTREGVDIGPFDTLTETEHGVEEFIDFIQASAPMASDVLKRYRAA